MDQVEVYNQSRETILRRVMRALVKEESLGVQLPEDSLLAGGWRGDAENLADVPEQLKQQIREEAVLAVFNRLESSLRLLLHATAPDREPPSQEAYRKILDVWRFELEDRASLVPDTYAGAVQKYDPEMVASYAIAGRCDTGDLLRIKVPCWRLFGRVVIRGEAEPLEPGDAKAAAAEPVAAVAVPVDEEVAAAVAAVLDDDSMDEDLAAIKALAIAEAAAEASAAASPAAEPPSTEAEETSWEIVMAALQSQGRPAEASPAASGSPANAASEKAS